MDYLIGIDIGTSSVKVTAFNLKGELLNLHAKDYPLHSPQAGYQEQDPDLIFYAILECCQKLNQQTLGNPLAMSFSSAMHSLMALDAIGKPLTPLITWADNRAAAIAKEFKSKPESQRIYQETGTPIHPMSPLCKLMWMKVHAPEIFAKAEKWLGIKSYIIYRLTGQLVMDYSLASATGLFDLSTQRWHVDALRLAGISASRLPELVPTSFIVGQVRDDFHSAMGVTSTTQMIIGASDGCLANLGAMALRPDQTVITIGTSAAIRATLPRPLADPQARIFNYWLDRDLYVVGGASNNGGVILEWYRNHFLSGMEFNNMLRMLQMTSPGAEGLLFFPYLLGERAPLWEPNARGGFFGLTLRHRQQHLLRALMEGICFNLYLIGEALGELGYPPRQVYANGGLTKSPAWVQLLADIFGVPVHIQGHQEGSGFGAVLIAMKALGLISDFSEMAGKVRTDKTFEPDKEKMLEYQSVFASFKKYGKILQFGF